MYSVANESLPEMNTVCLVTGTGPCFEIGRHIFKVNMNFLCCKCSDEKGQPEERSTANRITILGISHWSGNLFPIYPHDFFKHIVLHL